MLSRVGYKNKRSILYSLRHFFHSPCPASSSAPNLSLQRSDNIFWWNSAITSSLNNGDVANAWQLFEQMPRRNQVTWNCMLSGLVKNRRTSDAQRIFDLMPRKNVISRTMLLTAYAKSGLIEEARQLFDRIPERNVVCWNAMVSGYIHNGMLEKAREVFDGMPVKNNVSWSIMITAYLKNKLVNEAKVLFSQAEIRSTSICNALLSGYDELGRIRDAEDLFRQMAQRDVVSWNTMITCYSRAGKMELALNVFDEMPEKDIVSWTALMQGYLRNRNIEDAWRIFKAMPNRDVMTWNTMMAGFVQNGMLESALKLFADMPQRDIVSWNTILQGYVQQDDMASAKRWFEQMPERSETSWNTLISGYRDNEALVLFCNMVREGFRPDQGSFSVVISVCASLVALGWGRMLHLCVTRAGYQHDALVMSSLISMYSRCGLINDSALVFECITKRDTITWNSMIATYAYHGFATEAFSLFDKMIQNGFNPDHATFLTLLLACAHKGMVNEGCQYFVSMQKDWNLIPKPEHYSCMVDLLGRSGLVIQAHEFTKKIPVQLQTTAWETLLSSCRYYGNLELGKVAAEKVLDSQPADGGMHTLISNMYAAKGMWKNAESVRMLMKDTGLKKETGCSWIEVKGKVCSFVSNDKSDPLIQNICQELDNLTFIMES
ncbi:pentatricopeptide repeat-containing protein [Canna indica]|uniref:Pentatricopeptide repeat-containing protein n=1 Tax=Canna indica TaxID=4628 RepID=A0AAQ3QMM6_9LILI|nr:pentatricopeptide repeat-containing protein [Canna indica]